MFVYSTCFDSRKRVIYSNTLSGHISPRETREAPRSEELTEGTTGTAALPPAAPDPPGPAALGPGEPRAGGDTRGRGDTGAARLW